MCSKCYEDRPPEELLRIVPRREPWRWRLVCRPTINPGCFRARSAGAALERIEPATAPAPATT